ncbi:flagellar protein FlaG [Brevundimonas viscosa]|uniref:Flagellar protein FlaG n=1 Tax=Brevundimonas viscosa TaxID=871741 RepID=A0A1I6SG93_9CAUL|nr:flagellar protein FlaG [Brevundimonas viscosa]SFS75840.1 flagellar protein FlaG [Brevundimonas viscosa]
MQNNAKIDPVVVATTVTAAAGSSASGDFRDSRAQQEADQAARYRLVIEEGPLAGSFIYKTLDRVTGEVVKQLPREQVVEMMRAAAYNAGAVIDTRA